MKALTLIAILVTGCGSMEGGPDTVTGEANGPGVIASHWELLSPDPSLIIGYGGCYKLADSPVTEADCRGLSASFTTPDDVCHVTCTDTAAGADVTLTCGRCTGHYAVTFSQ